jgi:hypothetical protein
MNTSKFVALKVMTILLDAKPEDEEEQGEINEDDLGFFY